MTEAKRWNISPLYLEHGFCANDGSITVMEGSGDDAEPVATVLPTVSVKRGQGHKLKDDPLRDKRARLIAAASDLLEVAQMVAALDGCEAHVEDALERIIPKALAAISKAEGK